MAPALALTRTLPSAATLFASYAAGYAYLRTCGERVIDLGLPDGPFIDAVSPQALRVLETAERFAPTAIVIDGEFYLPATLCHLGVPVVYLANPHDLVGERNTFRRVNRLLLRHANAVIISSLSCRTPVLRRGLVPGTPCLEIPPLVKDLPPHRRSDSGKPRVLISMGGGSVGADRRFRYSTDAALAALHDALAELAGSGSITSATLVMGADVTPPATPPPPWLTVAAHPTELTGLIPRHDVLVARAGRNATAEALYAGIATVLIPITTDRHRGAEQRHNAKVAGRTDSVFAVTDWENRTALTTALRQAIARSQAAPRRAGIRGNEHAVRFLARLCSAVHDRRLDPYPHERSFA